MANVFTLDSLREEVEKEFAPCKIELKDGSTVTLRNLLRLPKGSRDAVLEALKKLAPSPSKEGEEEADENTLEEVAALQDATEAILNRVADRPQPLLRELDGDVALALQIINKWMTDTQAGEAENSPAS